MAFSNGLSGRMEELRYSGMRQNDNDGTFSPSVGSKRDSGPMFSGMTAMTTADVRSSLQRRFTADSGTKLGAGRASFSQQQFPALSTASQQAVLEDIQIARRKAQEQLALLDEKERKLQLNNAPPQEVDRFTGGFQRMSLNGPLSEPTTPPEYGEDAFFSRFPRTGRVSMSNVTSPPGFSKRLSGTASKITSPPGNRNSASALYSSHRQSTKSMPGSRRGSDEEDDQVDQLPTNRSAAAPDRFSMPINSSRYSTTTNLRRNAGTTINEHEHDPINSTYSALTGAVEEAFPTLRQDGSRLSVNLATEQMANSTVADSESLYNIHIRPGHASMPHTDSSMYRPVLSANAGGTNESKRSSQRLSTGFSQDEFTVPTTTNMAGGRPAVLQTSFSSNDVPTEKNNFPVEHNLAGPPHSSHADSKFHAHNISMGRIPMGAVNNRQTRDVQVLNSVNNFLKNETDAYVSFTQPEPPMSLNMYGSSFPTDLPGTLVASPINNVPTSQMYQFNLNNYNVPNTTNLAINGHNSNHTQTQVQYSRQDARNGKRGPQEHRLDNVPLESCLGHLYAMAKDQHGCRYMQRKLEDGNPEHIQAIFAETCPYITDLMTDPFGNYLCQKLFEHCDDDQRTALIETASPSLPTIALNQHGTRALQKMIEYLRTPHHIDTIIHALSTSVVDLVQDLNGNHVVQKCLQVLGAEQCQFIYDNVGAACIKVGTHRHGCCVLQRCIDHARGMQRAVLVAQITHCAFHLVQDQYGNYVVQYILDLDEMAFTHPLCQSFRGQIAALSKMKFSSNVIEKCLRVSDPQTKADMIEEILNGNELEKMLKDSFANYVVQTAIDYSDPITKQRLIDSITPLLPAIKQTPHGRRIASKVQTLKSSQNMPPQIDNTFSPPRSSNRRHIQINGGGFVFGGRGFATGQQHQMQQPMHHPIPAEDYGSGQFGIANPLGFQTAQSAFAPQHGNGFSTGNYI